MSPALNDGGEHSVNPLLQIVDGDGKAPILFIGLNKQIVPRASEGLL
jgi:hypothetical protein